VEKRAPVGLACVLEHSPDMCKQTSSQANGNPRRQVISVLLAKINQNRQADVGLIAQYSSGNYRPVCVCAVMSVLLLMEQMTQCRANCTECKYPAYMKSITIPQVSNVMLIPKFSVSFVKYSFSSFFYIMWHLSTKRPMHQSNLGRQ